jgi:hypothetical protein
MKIVFLADGLVIVQNPSALKELPKAPIRDEGGKERFVEVEEKVMEIDHKALHDKIRWLRLKREREVVAITSKPEVTKRAAPDLVTLEGLKKMSKEELMQLRESLMDMQRKGR